MIEKKYVGIDFSLNSTGLCIVQNNRYRFLNFINSKSLMNKKGDKALSPFKIHDEIKDFIEIIFVNRDKLNIDYSKGQIQKLNDYDLLTDLIIESIPENSIVGLEGFSYSSTGRSDIDLIMAQTLLRYKLIKNNHILNIISPANLKKFFTGKGNANKIAMYYAFIKEDNFNHSLYDYILNHDLIKNEKFILKPIDDLIDAYSIVKFLKNN